ncbi:MAG: hypothetical protein JNK05_09335 [Myxococcales bacterium]|nr:hypothetical protein [Myxococcales bacterium]
MNKRDESIQWWDRGRARWRSRPEKKERSYDEAVGGRRRPVRELYGLSRSPVREALARCRAEVDDDLLDRAVERCSERTSQWRWKHSLPRKFALDRKRVRRVCGYGRRHWVKRAWAFRWMWLCKMKVARDFRSMYALKVAFTDAARAVFASAERGALRKSASETLEEHPLFVEHVPNGWRRRSLARRCIRALAREKQQAARFSSTLWSIIEGGGRFAPKFAVVFYVALHRDDAPRWLRECTCWYSGYSERLEHELAKDPALDAAMRAWIEEHLPPESEIPALFDLRSSRRRIRW